MSPQPLSRVRALLRRVSRPLLAASLACCCAVSAVAQKASTPPERPPIGGGPMPPPARFIVPQAAQPIELQHYRQEVHVVGRTVHTRLTLVLHNPNPRVLEGELQLPLASGQTLTGLALDIEGDLRRAVPVPRAKGLQVFEDIVRGQVDPALLEAGPGNVYKLRVYPLPARGARRVVLDIAQALPAGTGGRPATLQLPLGLDLPATRAEFQLQLAGVPHASVQLQARGLPAGALVPTANSQGTMLQLAARPLPRPALLSVQWPQAQDALVQAAHFDGEDFVYAELPAPTSSRPRPAPRRLALVWDASGSAAQRNTSAELAVLDALFARWQNLQVQLHVLRDRLEAPLDFTVRGGDWQALRAHLLAEPVDGATQLGVVQLPAGSADLALLVSDGQANFGAPQPPRFGMPVFVLQSSLGAETAALRAVAEWQGGGLIDLLATSTAQAVQHIIRERPRLLALRSNAGQRWVAESRQPGSGRLAVAGVLNAPTGTLEAVFALPGGGQQVQRVAWRLHAAALPAPQPNPPSASRPEAGVDTEAGPPLPAWRWARLQLDSLSLRPDLHRTEIEGLGHRFGLATAETSLIVLDNLADYVRHGIQPPAGPLRAAWQQQRGNTLAASRQQQQAHLEQLLRRWREREAWWATEFPKDAPPPPPREAKVGGAVGEDQRAQRQGPAPTGAPRPAAAPLMPAAPAPAPAPAPALAAAALPERRANADSAARSRADATVGGEAPTARIALSTWQPDAPYARRLRAAAPHERYAVYLDERPNQLQRSAFFLDAADLFFAQGDAALGRRVLSNLAEMAIDNRALLRLLGYRLLQAGEAALAVPVFERVQQLAPHEPQSHRDLGLALADAGQWQPAAAALWHTASQRWTGGRFPDIDLTALAELNALLAKAQRAGRPLDTAGMDERLLKNLPLGLRVVLSWDADNTDIDLHVVDPDGQEAFYGRPRTHQGGRMSADFTGGYGPEEFALRKPKPGVYTVRARFYGHRQQLLSPATTLMLRLSTGFGTAAEQEQRVMLRLTGQGDMVKVGQFRVEAPSD